MPERVNIKQKVLSENDKFAAQIRKALKEHKIPCLNLVSSPGSGKTSLLEHTLKHFKDEIKIAIIVGDVQTENDAVRLSDSGGKIIRPIITGGACHLDAKMINKVFENIDINEIDLLIIENVGNLVCPSSYDLGEDMKVVLISTTEGDDKPSKYPAMFRRSSVMVINKIDLLGMSDFELSKVKENALNINGNLQIIDTSCRTKEGLEEWYKFLEQIIEDKKTILE